MRQPWTVPTIMTRSANASTKPHSLKRIEYGSLLPSPSWLIVRLILS
jgi:hypothetical protein